MNPQDKRRAVRSKHDSVIEIYDTEGRFIKGTGRLVNFSKVGICFSSTHPLALGEPLRARLRLLREGALEISARVVWTKKRPAGMLYGLAFDAVQTIRP